MASPTFYELSTIAGAVYGGDDSASLAAAAAGRGWAAGPFYRGRGNFQGCVYRRGHQSVVAFRGTVFPNMDDLSSDVMLGGGMNTSHFAAAEDFMAQANLSGKVTLTGHSLGGAIAQIIGNRQRLPFVTYNAPGVAVLASRNIWTANPVALSARIGGAALGTITHFGQTMRDIGSTFYKVKGVNLCLLGDPVSQWGVHYGKVIRMRGIGHGIANLVSKLNGSSTGSETLDTYYRA